MMFTLKNVQTQDGARLQARHTFEVCWAQKPQRQRSRWAFFSVNT